MNQLPFAMRHFVEQQLMPMLHKLAPYGDLGPRVEVSQRGDEIIVKAELPGLSTPDNVDIHVQETSLTLSGTLEREGEGGDEINLFHTERLYGPFSRTVPLPVPVNPDEVRASCKHGLLTVSMKKSTKLQGRRVNVDFS